MQHKSSTTLCPKCKGIGTVMLSAELQIVMDLIRKKHEVTAYEVKDALDPSGLLCDTAFHSRLQLLLKMRHVKRRKAGRTWFYSATQKAIKGNKCL